MLSKNDLPPFLKSVQMEAYWPMLLQEESHTQTSNKLEMEVDLNCLILIASKTDVKTLNLCNYVPYV